MMYRDFYTVNTYRKAAAMFEKGSSDTDVAQALNLPRITVSRMRQTYRAYRKCKRQKV